MKGYNRYILVVVFMTGVSVMALEKFHTLHVMEQVFVSNVMGQGIIYATHVMEQEEHHTTIQNIIHASIAMEQDMIGMEMNAIIVMGQEQENELY